MRMVLKFGGLLILLLATTAALAQGCSMCKTSAEAAAAEQQKALNHGILILAVPSVLIFGGLSVFAARYRSKGGDARSRIDKSGSTDLL